MSKKTYTHDEVAKALGHPAGTTYVRDEKQIRELIDEARELGDSALVSDLLDALEEPMWEAYRDALYDHQATITAAEKYVLDSEVDRLIDVTRGRERILSVEAAVGLIDFQVRSWLKERLRLKAMTAAYAEYWVSDNPPLNGIVGKAIDQAIADLRPYMHGHHPY